MKILKINEIYELQVAKTMYRNSVLNLAKPLHQLYTPNTQLHDYNTRNRDNPLVSLHKLAIGQNSIVHKGPLIWNDAPKEVRNSVSMNAKFKKLLLNRYSM